MELLCTSNLTLAKLIGSDLRKKNYYEIDISAECPGFKSYLYLELHFSHIEQKISQCGYCAIVGESFSFDFYFGDLLFH